LRPWKGGKVIRRFYQEVLNVARGASPEEIEISLSIVLDGRFPFYPCQVTSIYLYPNISPSPNSVVPLNARERVYLEKDDLTITQ